MTVDDARPGSKPPAPPHPYIPPGPVETAPYAGYCQPETRQAAFAAVLQGVQMGAYDTQIINWLVGWDDTTCRTIASLMWRCRLAGAAQLAARLDGLRQLLTAVLTDEHRSRQLALEHAEAELADICAAGPVPAGSVTLTAAEAGIIRQAPADEPWARTSDRSTWRAYKGGLVLTVTRVAGGTGWQATVESPNTTERSPAPLPTRLAAQSWCDNRAGGAR